MSFANIKWPIRLRLVTLSALGLTGILLMFHVLAWFLLKNWLVRKEEEELKNKLLSVREVCEERAETVSRTSWLEPLVEQGQAVRIVRNGRVVALVDKGIPKEELLPVGQANSPSGISRHFRRNTLALTLPFHQGEGRVELYTDFSVSARFVRTAIEVLAGASALLSAAFLGVVHGMAKAALRPVAAITGAVREFDPARRSHRLNVPDTGDEITMLSQMINSLLDRIYLMMQQRNRFLSDVSHELRTPIAVIRGYVGLLRRWGLKNPDVTEEALTTLDQELTRVEGLTERLLRLARHEMEEMPQEEEIFSLSQMVQERVKRWSCVCPDLHYFYTLPENEVKYRGLKADLEELLDMLLDNARKYTERGGTVSVFLEKGLEELTLSVRDTGQGIPDADLPHVFKRFYRVKRNRQARVQGTGLGLAIAMQIVQKYKGRLEICSKLGHGTMVTAFFPLSDANLT
jgi:signal transduction histidine kinase